MQHPSEHRPSLVGRGRVGLPVRVGLVEGLIVVAGLIVGRVGSVGRLNRCGIGRMSAVKERVQEIMTKGMIRKTRNRKTKKFMRISHHPLQRC
jgi:hypothetical protein